MWVASPFLLNSIYPHEAFWWRMGCSWECRLCWHHWHEVSDGRERGLRAVLPCCRFIHTAWQFRSANANTLCVCVWWYWHWSIPIENGWPSSTSHLHLYRSLFLLVSPLTALHGPLWREAMICFCVWSVFFFYASSALLTYFILIPWCDFNRLYVRGGEEECLWVWGGRKGRLKDRDTVQGR